MDPQQRPRTVPNPLTSDHDEDASDSSSSASEHDTERMPMPSHHVSHGAVASHFQAYGGETWMDFLRDFGTDAPPVNHPQPPDPATSSSHSRQPSYTLPNRPLPLPRTDSSSSRSSERKRRLTSAESQPLRRPSGIRVPSHGAGSSSTDPIMISASPPNTRRPSSSRASMAPTRRQSDIVIPTWQPDAEVSECPVCGRPFTFLYRKHHCRKCGRVVCAACSPHRITIPRQFIVHPPTDNSQNIIDLTGEDGDNTMSSFGPFRNPALGGGEEVRVCNPCVPDPNFSPPPQYNPSSGSRYPPRTSSSRPTYPPPQMPPHRQHRVSSSVHNAGQTVGHQTMHRTRDSSNTTTDNRRVSYHGSTSSRDRWLPPVPGQTGTGRHTQFGYVGTPVPSNDNPPYIPHPNHYGSTTPGGGNMFPRIFAPVPQVPAHFPPGEHTQRPRRQIAEEDECPICGHELPPRDPQDDDAARTQHITECITLHSASPPPNPLTQQTSASLPNQRTRGMSNAGGGGRGNNEAGSSNPNRLSHATRGMFPYVATEKDCVDEDGETAECIICLEDLEAGVKMARLVCWCKFHEDCIKEWWEKKGRGACPTHQLQE